MDCRKGIRIVRSLGEYPHQKSGRLRRAGQPALLPSISGTNLRGEHWEAQRCLGYRLSGFPRGAHGPQLPGGPGRPRGHPQAKEAFARFIAAVCDRYKTSPAIGGWILGNEFAFYDLWENTAIKNQVGYDEQVSLPSFRAFLAQTYGGSIEKLNSAWGTNFLFFPPRIFPISGRLRRTGQPPPLPGLSSPTLRGQHRKTEQCLGHEFSMLPP